MKTKTFKTLILLLFLFSFQLVLPQDAPQPEEKPKNPFWEKVQFGGGFGLGVGNGFTNISLSPTAVYNFNKYIAAGTGIQYSFLKQRSIYTSNMYGISGIFLANPIEEIQLSVELEQLKVNVNYSSPSVSDRDFWNTGLFLGAGYRMDGVIIGARYNVLFDENENVYGDALIPFVRIFF